VLSARASRCDVVVTSRGSDQYTVSSSENESETEWYQEIVVNNTNRVKFKLDSGAQINVIPKLELEKWKQKPIVHPTQQPVNWTIVTIQYH